MRRAFLLCALCVSNFAHATLGQPVSSVATDQTRLKASVLATDSGSYTDHVLTLEAGITLHEYSSSDGTVFAVAWKGPVMPDLRQLLGEHFATVVNLRKATGNRGHGLSQFHNSQSSIVIHSGGHLGAFSGMVYLPGKVPSGLDVEALP